MFHKVNNIHFVGIGGIGMSGIAELLINQGFVISGSDLVESEITKKLEINGAKIFIGHNKNNINGSELLVYSSAVTKNNPELVEAEKSKIPIIKRAEMLGELVALKETSIGVAGTHGKTSTSSMLGALLTYGKMDPTLVVGGLVQNLNTNSLLGQSDLIVFEADEYDKSFLQMNPTIAIINNIEEEHMDCYKDINDLHDSFIQFANSVPFYGGVAVCIDSIGIQQILPKIKRPIITYGFSKEADIYAEEISYKELKTSFTLYNKNKKCGRVKLNVPGKHNILNSLAAITIGYELGLDSKTIIAVINSYSGVRRRFEIKGEAQGIIVVDDYAHHPTEVEATLQAAKKGWDRRIISVFQPHLFSRTKIFYKEFAKAFMSSDILLITDIYPAREKPIDGVSGKLIFNAAKSEGHKNIYYINDLEEINDTLDKITEENDMVITIGAGTIWRYGQSYFDHLKDKVKV